MMVSIVWNKLLGMFTLLLLVSVSLTGICFAQSTAEMVTVSAVEIGSTEVVLNTDSKELVFTAYTLGAPPRLVVDLANALPEFSERSFVINDGYSRMRVGLYADKTRFVLDALDGVLPDARVVQQGDNLVIVWGEAEPKITAIETTTIESGAPISIKSIDFDASDGVSVFKVDLSSDAQLISPVVDGDIVRFGVKNTVIPRSLRRVVDASVFPSSVLQITPYSTIVDGERRVMFAARMKGPVEYDVSLSGGSLIFRAEDGSFAEVAADKFASVIIPIDQVKTSVVDDGDQMAQVIESLSTSDCSDTDSQQDVIGSEDAPVKLYTGEPVSLVFDDADIRKVMQLIAEISDLNLILSDGVKGKITLRLNEVPWDQALDLILDIKELGRIDQGNVVRILPQKKIEAMKTERLQAKQTIKRLEETETRIFEINYKDTDSFEDVIEDMLSDQGEVSIIEGTKKILVTDIPSKLIEIANMIIEIDSSVRQVLIEARIVEASNGSDLNLGVNWGLGYSNDDTGEIGIEHADNGNAAFGGNFLLPSSIGTSGFGADMTFGRLGFDSLVLDLKLSALEEMNEVKVISSPKVLTLDGEEAEISDGVQIPYKTISDEGTTTEFQDATLSLKVTPEVNPDNTVILTIEASNSSPGSTYSDGTGINEKIVKTKLLMKSGQTTVIGGVYIDKSTDNDRGVPFLKDIPYVGGLFRSTLNKRERREMLIFITPTIVQ